MDVHEGGLDGGFALYRQSNDPSEDMATAYACEVDVPYQLTLPDGTVQTGMVEFEAGDAIASIPLGVDDDTIVQGDEIVRLDVTPSTSGVYTLANGTTAELTVTDDESPATPVSPNDVIEELFSTQVNSADGDSVLIPINRTGPLNQPFVFGYVVITASGVPAGGVATLPAGEASGVLTVDLPTTGPQAVTVLLRYSATDPRQAPATPTQQPIWVQVQPGNPNSGFYPILVAPLPTQPPPLILPPSGPQFPPQGNNPSFGLGTPSAPPSGSQFVGPITQYPIPTGKAGTSTGYGPTLNFGPNVQVEAGVVPGFPRRPFFRALGVRIGLRY